MCVKSSNWRIFHQSRSWRERVTNSHRASIPNSFKDSCSSSCLRAFVVSFSISVIQKVAGVVAPAHLNVVAGLEELGAPRGGVGQQRLDALATGKLDDVHGDVAEIKEVVDLARETVQVRPDGKIAADRHFLWTQRQHAPQPRLILLHVERGNLADAV